MVRMDEDRPSGCSDCNKFADCRDRILRPRLCLGRNDPEAPASRNAQHSEFFSRRTSRAASSQLPSDQPLAPRNTPHMRMLRCCAMSSIFPPFSGCPQFCSSLSFPGSDWERTSPRLLPLEVRHGPQARDLPREHGPTLPGTERARGSASRGASRAVWSRRANPAPKLALRRVGCARHPSVARGADGHRPPYQNATHVH